jgi:translation initiation factor IF-2
LDGLKELMAELLPPEEIIEVQGEADVLQTFNINVKGKLYETIAGCRIQTGKIQKNMKFR